MSNLTSRRLNLIFIAGLTLLAFGLRLRELGAPSLWYDELLELDIVQGPLAQIWPQLRRHAATPLDYYLLHGWVQLGRQEAWVRFPALVAGTLAVPAIYALGRRLFNRRAGSLAALLLAPASFSIGYSQEARPYALLLLLVTLSYLGLWRAVRTGRRRDWTLALAGLIGAALTHYFTLFLLLPMGLFVIAQPARRWRNLAWFALGVGALLAVFTAAGRLNDLYNVGGRFLTVVSQPETLTLPPEEKPNRGEGPSREPSFFVERVLMPLGTNQPPALLLYNALLLVAVLPLARPPRGQDQAPFEAAARTRTAGFLLLGWLVLPTGLIYLFLLQRGTFFAVRYILYALPAYLILVAAGLDALVPRSGGRWSRASGLIGGALLLLALGSLLRAEAAELQAHYAAGSREDWRAVGRLLEENARPEDAVIAVNAEPAINWYYPAASAPFGTFNRSAPIWQAMDRHPRRWFVLSSYSFRRDKGLRDWLAAQQAVYIPIDRRVVVYFQAEGLSGPELLDQVKTFALPPRALTYAALADQFGRYGDLETSRRFYQTAVELAHSPGQRAVYEARLAGVGSPRAAP